MDQQNLHNKVIQSSKRNRKLLFSVQELIGRRRRDIRQKQESRLSDFYKQYQQLLKLNNQSEQQTFRLKKEIGRLDNQIQQLSHKDMLTRSKIKIHTQQIQTIKQQTHDNHYNIRRQNQIVESNQDLLEQVQRLQREIRQKQQSVDSRKKRCADYQSQCQELTSKRQLMYRQQDQTNKRYEQRIGVLEQELRQLGGELQLAKAKQYQKTRRNSKVQVLDQIRGLLRKHKQSYSNFDSYMR